MVRSRSIVRMVFSAAASLALAASPTLANWTALPGAVQLSSTAAATQTRTAPDGLGGMYVAWRDSLGPDWVQHLDRSGNPTWPAPGIQISDGTFPPGWARVMQMDVCTDDVGGVFVAYEDYHFDSPIGTRSMLSRLDITGATMPGFPVQLNTVNTNFNTLVAEHPAVASDGSGNAIVAWSDARNAVSGPCLFQQLLAQKVDATGHKLWAEGGVAVCPPDGLGTHPEDEAAMRPAPSGGGAYFTWTTFDQFCGGNLIRLQRIDASGTAQFGPAGLLILNVPGTAEAYDSAYCYATGSDCIVIAWDYDAGRAMRVNAAGATIWTTPLELAHATIGATAADGLGGVWVTWYSTHANGLLVQDVDPTGVLKLPSFDSVSHGEKCADSGVTALAIVRDGKQGAIMTWSGPGFSPAPVHAVGVGATGRPAFQSAGLMLSLSAQNTTDLSGVPGLINNGLFAWANSNGVWAQQVTLSDLDATTTPSGWAGPLVPRSNNNSTTSFVPPTALIESETTYLNWVVTQRGPNPTPAFQSRVYLDGGFFWGLNVPDGAGPGFYPLLNFNSTINIPGGPHTLTLYTDWEGTPDFSIDEANEADDVWSGQWTWEPSWVLVGPSLDMPAGPIGKFPMPNGNSHKFHVPAPLSPGGAPNAWVVSDAARRGPTFGGPAGGVIGYGDSYGFELYDAPVGVAEFTHQVDASHQPYNGTNFILGLGSATPESLYTLQVRDSTQDTNPDSCWFDFQQADGRSGAVGMSWTNQQMAAGELADVYILNAVVRQPMRLTVRKHEGLGPTTGRLAFELFAPGSAATFHRGAGFGSLTHDADAETLTVVATRSGPYLAVVYRADGSTAGTPLTYDFMTSSTQTLDAPVTPRVLALRGATPNPASATRMTIAFELPSDAPARLEVVDVGGRRVLSRDLGGMGAGLHAVDLANGGRIAPGVYWVRLTQGPSSRMARVAVVD